MLKIIIVIFLIALAWEIFKMLWNGLIVPIIDAIAYAVGYIIGRLWIVILIGLIIYFLCKWY